MRVKRLLMSALCGVTCLTTVPIKVAAGPGKAASEALPEQPNKPDKAALQLPEIIGMLPGEVPFNVEPMPTGETCGWLTERDWPDVKARLAQTLGEGWAFDEVEGVHLERMRKGKMFGDQELLGAVQVTHPGTDAWKFGVTLSKAPDGRRNIFSVVTFDKKLAEAAEEMKKPDSPGFTAQKFADAAARGDAEALEGLFAAYPGVPPEVADWLASERGKQLKVARQGFRFKLLEQYSVGDCAVIVVKETNPDRAKSLDIDPLYLLRQNGAWRMHPLRSEWDFADNVPEDRLPEQMKATEEQRKAFGQLTEIFETRKDAIRARAKRRSTAPAKGE